MKSRENSVNLQFRISQREYEMEADMEAGKISRIV